MRDASREMAIEALALAETDWLDQIATWRSIARAAIHQLHERHLEITRLRQQLAAMREEMRRRHSAARVRDKGAA